MGTEALSEFIKTKKAIRDRGRNPLNRVLLLDPDLTATTTITEKTGAYQLQHNIILPKNHMDTLAILTSKSMPSESEISSESHNNLPSLNFSSGESAFCLKSIISQEQLQLPREKFVRICKRGRI